MTSRSEDGTGGPRAVRAQNRSQRAASTTGRVVHSPLPANSPAAALNVQEAPPVEADNRSESAVSRGGNSNRSRNSSNQRDSVEAGQILTGQGPTVALETELRARMSEEFDVARAELASTVQEMIQTQMQNSMNQLMMHLTNLNTNGGGPGAATPAARSVISKQEGRVALEAAANLRAKAAQAEVDALKADMVNTTARLQAELEKKTTQAQNASHELSAIRMAGSIERASSVDSQSVTESEFVRGVAANLGGVLPGAVKASKKAKSRTKRTSTRAAEPDTMVSADSLLRHPVASTVAVVVPEKQYTDVIISPADMKAFGQLPPDNSAADPTWASSLVEAMRTTLLLAVKKAHSDRKPSERMPLSMIGDNLHADWIDALFLALAASINRNPVNVVPNAPSAQQIRVELQSLKNHVVGMKKQRAVNDAQLLSEISRKIVQFFEKRSGVEYTLMLYNLTVPEGAPLGSVLPRLQELINTSASAHPDEAGSRQNDTARKQAITILMERYYPELSLQMKTMVDNTAVDSMAMIAELQASRDASFRAKAYTAPPPICLVAGSSPEAVTQAVDKTVASTAGKATKRNEIASISAAEEQRVIEVAAAELASVKCHNCNGLGHLMYTCPQPFNEANLSSNGQRFTEGTWKQYRRNYLPAFYQQSGAGNRQRPRNNRAGRDRNGNNTRD